VATKERNRTRRGEEEGNPDTRALGVSDTQGEGRARSQAGPAALAGLGPSGETGDGTRAVANGPWAAGERAAHGRQAGYEGGLGRKLRRGIKLFFFFLYKFSKAFSK
jgi:hypothetical protein